MTKIFMGLVIAIVGLGLWLNFQGGAIEQAFPAPEALPETANEEQWTVSASFMCPDGRTRFEAAFLLGELQLTRDGAEFRRMPQVSDVPPTFEDSEYEYVFVGEDAEVTNKATGETIVCGQLHDPNEAPVNFGDRGEGAGEGQDIAAAASMAIIGSWRSEDDPKFVQEFHPDNAVVDYYDGEQAMDSEWRVFTKTTASGLPNTDVPYPLKDNTAYLMIAADHEALFYEIIAVTPERLELIFLNRGGALRFSRAE